MVDLKNGEWGRGVVQTVFEQQLQEQQHQSSPHRNKNGGGGGGGRRSPSSPTFHHHQGDSSPKGARRSSLPNSADEVRGKRQRGGASPSENSHQHHQHHQHHQQQRSSKVAGVMTQLQSDVAGLSDERERLRTLEALRVFEEEALEEERAALRTAVVQTKRL